MKRIKRNNRGFTMAELLIVMAIITVLSGVGFIAVQQYQRGMSQTEYDSVAREIFVAAQNHLTLANSQGYPGVTDFGTKETDVIGVPEEAPAGYDSIYFIDTKGFSANDSSVLDLMLPFGSIDETVRAGGTYVVRYQTNPAVVLDVFYSPADGRYPVDLTNPTQDTYQTLLSLRGDENRNKRRNALGGAIGWYGGAESLETGEEDLIPPTIEVKNAEKLYVTITDRNAKLRNENTDKSLTSLKLIVEGESSHAKIAFDLYNDNDSRLIRSVITTENPDANIYSVVLDDITAAGMRFADLNSNSYVNSRVGAFYPGENITVSAVAFSNKVLTNIAYSSSITANSLFADMDVWEGGTAEADKGEPSKVLISNIRHLENLDKAVSGFASVVTDEKDETKSRHIQRAEQTVDLDWNDFKGKVILGPDGAAIEGKTADKVQVLYYAGEGEGAVATSTAEGCFKPVDLDYTLIYDGKGEASDASEGEDDEGGEDADTPSSTAISHKISNIKVDYAGDAGVFGKVEMQGGKIANLEIINCAVSPSVSASADVNAGALAGSVAGATVENVLARIDTTSTTYDPDKTGKVVAKASAGGLVGKLTAVTVGLGESAVTYGAMNRCAAALYVSGKDAGGLIGTVRGGVQVTASYAGGHTSNAAYETEADKINVIGTANAGGLIGDAGSASIKNSYSTCSVSGATVGGLVGSAGGSIENSYATGLVVGASESAVKGAFAGELKAGGSIDDKCFYYEIINGDLPVLGKGEKDDAGVTALDEKLSTYDAFIGAPNTWSAATAYDSTLNTYYGGRFNLKTVDQLGQATKSATSGESTDFVATHFGDWPAPETFVVNEAETTTP